MKRIAFFNSVDFLKKQGKSGLVVRLIKEVTKTDIISPRRNNMNDSFRIFVHDANEANFAHLTLLYVAYYFLLEIQHLCRPPPGEIAYQYPVGKNSLRKLLAKRAKIIIDIQIVSGAKIVSPKLYCTPRFFTIIGNEVTFFLFSISSIFI